MSSKKWVLMMLTLSAIYTPSLSQIGVPGMEYVEYLRTAPRKPSVSQEDAESEISVPKYSQDDTIYRRREGTDDNIYQRRQDVNVDETTMYRSQEDTGTKYRSQEDTGAKIFQRRTRTRVRPRKESNVEEIGSRELQKTEDENNQNQNQNQNTFTDYDYDTDTNNSIVRISTDSSPTVTEIYSEMDKVIPQSDIIKVSPKYYDRYNDVTDDTNNIASCRGSECELQATQETNKQSSVYQNYEDDASNQNILRPSTEGTKQYVKMIRIPSTTSNPIEDTIIYQKQPISNPVQDTIIHEQKPAFTENSPSYSTYPVNQRSTYPVGHRSGQYYAPNKGGRYPSGEVYTDNDYVPNQFQTDVYPQNTYPTNAYRQIERYDTADYPTITYPTYDDRVYQNPSYPSHYQAGPRPMAQLYYKAKTNPSSGFRPSEQYFPPNAAQQPVHNYPENLNTESLPIQHNSNPYSDSSIHRYSKVRPQSQAREDYNTNKRPTYRAPRYIRPQSLKNYDFAKVPKQIDLKKQVVTTPKPLDPAIEKILRARAAKEAANRYYTGLQMEIERSDIMADAVRAVRSRTHMKKVNTTKSPGKVKRSTTSNPAILSITKTAIILPENQYYKKDVDISGNRRESKSIGLLSNSRSKKDINIKSFRQSFHHNLPPHPLYKNLPGKENYDSLKITTKSPDIRQKALELKKFQKVKAQFDALVPKASYTPGPYPSYPSYTGQKIHIPRPTTFRPYVIPKYNKFYKPGQYIRPAKVQVSRLYQQKEYIPKYVRPESYKKDAQYVIRQSPPSSFIDIPKESVKLNPTSSYLQTSKEERPIVYHTPQVSPKYVIVRTPKQLHTSPEYTTNIKVQSNPYNAKREYRQAAETPENTKYHVPAIQNPPREYRAIISDDKSHHITDTYSNPRQHRGLIKVISEIPRVRQSYSPKPYTTEPYSNPRQHRALVKPTAERPKIQHSYSPKPYTREVIENPRQHRALVNPITERPKIQHFYSPKPYTTEVIENPRDKRRSMEVNIERNVKFPQFGYNIDRYFDDFPSFGFFSDQ